MSQPRARASRLSNCPRTRKWRSHTLASAAQVRRSLTMPGGRQVSANLLPLPSTYRPSSQAARRGLARPPRRKCSACSFNKIVDNAWRTAGVRELIATPLYLSALLSGGSQGASPTTKEEVLRLFVQQDR